jgi:predicted HTH domain antitoxin
MPLVIPDEVLRAADLSESEARVEIACRFFDAGKLSFGHAADAAGMNQPEFADAFVKRQIPRYRYTADDLPEDCNAIEKHARG